MLAIRECVNSNGTKPNIYLGIQVVINRINCLKLMIVLASTTF